MLAHPEGIPAIFFVNQVSYHTDLETVHRKVHFLFLFFKEYKINKGCGVGKSEEARKLKTEATYKFLHF